MAEHELEKLLGGFAADTLTPEEKQRLYQAALQDQQLFDALADEQTLKELLTDPAVRRRLLQALNKTTPVPAGGSASWLDWFRRPANLALAGGLATAVFAVILGTRISQNSLKEAAQSVATEAANPATPPIPAPAATQPTPSQPAEPKSKAKETEAPAPAVAKKDRLTDKPATGERVAPSQLPGYKDSDSLREDAPKRTSQEEDRNRAEAPIAVLGKTSEGVTPSADQQLAAGSPAAAPERMKQQPPARASLPEASSSTISARTLFYGGVTSTDAGVMTQDKKRDMKPLGEAVPQIGQLQRKLEGLPQSSKAASPVMLVKPLGLRYSFVIQNAAGQEQEIDTASAAKSTAPVQLTIEANQDGYIQIWKNVGSANTQLLLPLKESGHISMKIQAGQRQRLALPADSGTVIVRLSRVPFGPISRQEAVLLNRVAPNQLQESVTASSPTGPQEQATYIVSQDHSPTAQIAVDILPARQQ